MLPVAVDAMGGDRAPGEVVAGARRAADELGVGVLLVGPADLGATVDIGDLDLFEASEVVGMGEDPAQGVRRKKDSSVVRAAEAVRDGRASAMVSAGNTGAAMAAALLRMGRIKGVTRPAIAAPIPTPGGRPSVLLDAGANAEVQPDWLVQFAQMGSVYARHRLEIPSPRVGLLTIGEEAGKGDGLRKATYELLGFAPGLDFVGNVEGRDLFRDVADVFVTDGFTGNVLLKSLERCSEALVGWFEQVFASSPEFAPAVATLRPALDPLYEAIEPETYGGAMLLGVRGVCVISHGSSSSRAVFNAVRVARDLAESRIVEELAEALAST